MKNFDTQYTDILKEILEHGVERDNRTTEPDIFIPSAEIKHDLRNGFPAITTKQLFFKQSIGEVLGFIRGYENAQDFADLGCKFWFSDANENKTWLQSPYRKGENDLGKVYGSIWRNRTVYKNACPYDNENYLANMGYKYTAKNHDGTGIFTKRVDQLHDVIDAIMFSPNNRRIIMHAWFPELFDELALPACHVLYRFIPDAKNKVLHLSMTQRSTDFYLGAPMNLFGSALLLKLIAHATGYIAGQITHSMADVHLYKNAVEQATIQTEREPIECLTEIELPTCNVLTTNDALYWLETLKVEDVIVTGYQHQVKLERVEMAQEK